MLFDGPFRAYTFGICISILAKELTKIFKLSIRGNEVDALDDPYIVNDGLKEFLETTQGNKNQAFDVHIRNSWPVFVADMVGEKNGFVCWGWEEDTIPYELVKRFNQLDFVSTMSQFAKNVLLSSGVTIPVHSSGLGYSPSSRNKTNQPSANCLATNLI